MAQDEIKLDYSKAEDMVRTFKQGAEKLQDAMQEIQKIANTLEEGALIGQGGQKFVESLRGKLTPSLSKLIELFNSLEGNVTIAINLMREADEGAAQRVSAGG